MPCLGIDPMPATELDQCERVIVPSTELLDDHRCQAIASPRQMRSHVPRGARGARNRAKCALDGADDGQTGAFGPPKPRERITPSDSRCVDFGGNVDNMIPQKSLDRDPWKEEYPVHPGS